jgi:hypothetical protein
MPKRTDLQSILILGSGPIVIGQAAPGAESVYPIVSAQSNGQSCVYVAYGVYSVQRSSTNPYREE